mmetsp:Transcript_5019/g.13145  ORF Transcript_5019/g.13145 Transcript_5019/m.13145 type:complete len:207 (-) Transcript_5019:1379-1999(-)
MCLQSNAVQGLILEEGCAPPGRPFSWWCFSSTFGWVDYSSSASIFADTFHNVAHLKVVKSDHHEPTLFPLLNASRVARFVFQRMALPFEDSVATSKNLERAVLLVVESALKYFTPSYGLGPLRTCAFDIHAPQLQDLALPHSHRTDVLTFGHALNDLLEMVQELVDHLVVVDTDFLPVHKLLHLGGYRLHVETDNGCSACLCKHSI